MQAKKFTLINKGMNRDLSISKTGQSVAFENHNIRIMARDNDTLLSVTNERGTKKIEFSDSSDKIEGKVIGYNVLNNHIILFTTNDPVETGETKSDKIYRIDYDKDEDEFSLFLLFDSDLGFSCKHAIESVTDYESENVQKIYWADGKNVLRFMNFVAAQWFDGEKYLYPWQTDDDTYDNTYFDCNRGINSTTPVSVTITKDGTGTTRPNGTIQYFLTYYNKYGQETGIIWSSDIIYLAPTGRGGEADGTNTNNIKLSFSNVSDDFDNFRIYSVFRSSVNGPIIASIVADRDTDTNSGTLVIADDGSHHTAIDVTKLLYLGSKPVTPGTLESKDGVLFIGDLQNAESDIDGVVAILHGSAYMTGSSADKVTFVYSDGTNAKHIPYVEKAGLYPYENQLVYADSSITTFKYGEKYRFSVKLYFADGSSSDAIWVGDKENTSCPPEITDNHIRRAIAKFEITSALNIELVKANVKYVQLLVAEASFSDRAVIAQGIINPTLFNAWERHEGRLFSMPSWVTRARKGGVAYKHFDALKSSNNRYGEVQCNYPLAEEFEKPYLPDHDVTWGEGTYYYNAGYYSVVIYFDAQATNNLTVYIVSGEPTGGNLPTAENGLYSFDFKFDSRGERVIDYVEEYAVPTELPGTFTAQVYEHNAETPLYRITYYKYIDKKFPHNLSKENSRREVANCINAVLQAVNIDITVTESNINTWRQTLSYSSRYFNTNNTSTGYKDYQTAALLGSSTPSSSNWTIKAADSDTHAYTTTVTATDKPKNAYFRKNLTYVDESIVTLNSPEIEYGAVDVDNAEYNFRVIGIAEMYSGINDYTVDASMGKLSGKNLLERDFSKTGVMLGKFPVASWPLWTEKELTRGRLWSENIPDINRNSDVYDFGYNSIRYWIYMWQKSGVISGYRPTYEADTNDTSGVSVSVDDNTDRYSYLHRKVIANMTFCYDTKYVSNPSSFISYTPDSLRVFNNTASQYTTIKIGGLNKYYDGVVDLSLTLPSGHKYPIFYSSIEDSLKKIWDDTISVDKYLYTDDPVHIQYATRPHAIISLGTIIETVEENETNVKKETQKILPKITGETYNAPNEKICWDDSDVDKYATYDRSLLNISASASTPYLLIGEIYKTFTNDTRYGGTSKSAVKANRFIPAGKRYKVTNSLEYIYGDKGDTYFQRYDCLRTIPLSESADNNVIDIVSVMLETHINLDGRADTNRGTKHIASIDTTQYGSLNPVYSQRDNFTVSRVVDKTDDNYRSHISWSLEKHSLADIDEWTHVTLANTLPLDAYYGTCQSLYTFRNNLIAFQDRGIAEVLFNSRVQISASDGVPVELTNSGKVDGKRYLTTSYGCVNKFSIVEGKSALYFVDGINKMFGAAQFDQRGRLAVENISEKLGFAAWFREHNTTEQWPNDNNAFISFFDSIHSDVYLVRKDDVDGYGTLVYNENLHGFTSFFDYYDVPAMFNFEDRFISVKGWYLWQHEAGLFCKLHDTQYNFSMQYRVAPEPQTDKIWSNIDYRADFYRILDANGNLREIYKADGTHETYKESGLIDGGYTYSPAIPASGNDAAVDEVNIPGVYMEEETFSKMKVWNEYQKTNEDAKPIKKFRIWRYTIPRAVKTKTNKYGLDRIRNPWVNILFSKTLPTDSNSEDNNRDLMQLHDIDVTYYE